MSNLTDAETWALIHRERAGVADTLDELSPEEWATPSLCAGWSVQQAAGHIAAGGEQTAGHFAKGLLVNGFRFNTMIDRDARRLGALEPAEIVERIRATASTTNRPPAPVMAMLGEVVVHGEDIRRALGREGDVDPAATAACLEMYTGANFPVGGKKRIAGLRLVATDTDWSHGTGPEVTGPGLRLLLAMTGRPAGLDGLSGDGLDTFRERFPR